MREIRLSGSVEGVMGNHDLYSDSDNENFRTISAGNTSRDAVFFSYHGRRSNRYLLRVTWSDCSPTVVKSPVPTAFCQLLATVQP